jgi:hypothetical protein
MDQESKPRFTQKKLNKIEIKATLFGPVFFFQKNKF